MRELVPNQGHGPLHRFLDKRARWLAPACVLGLATPLISDGLVGLSGTLEWIVDLASHWQWLYLSGLILACTIASFNDRRLVLWLLALPLFWLTASAPTSDVGYEKPPNARVLTIVSANVNLENRDTTSLVRWLAEAKPDALVLQEVSPEYAKKLDALLGFPFRHLVPRNDPFGIVVLSRFPITHVQTVKDEDGIEHIDALIDWNCKQIRLTAWHPMPPISQYDHTKRNHQLLALAKKAKASGQPAIVAGDFNATPWSSAFSKLDQAGLRRASGLTPTWPAVGRGWMGIPIDHVLVTSQWSIVEREVGPNLGSDHLPVLVRIALRDDKECKH